MTDATDRIAVPCPACSPEFETVHEVLSEGGQATVRCTECGHVHKTSLPEETTLQRDVVVSQDGESFAASTDVPAEETLAVGEEFLLETDEAIMTVRITSLELDEDRVEQAPAEAVRTIWTRAVGNVSVDATVHPKDGDREGTRSETLHVPGDYEFVVGETDELGDLEFTIEGIHLRADAHGYTHEKLDHDGDMAFAKDVKRLLVRDESSTAWSAW
ncbi:HVO_0476 family zinc finger protein [Halapricum desulfuricans]|uniref:Putative archaeal Zn-finger protein n=1 Tax=Halapricum desulfuricans TaxID=2841257 RepID=A0A897NNY0_9EURY|nr:HVO_0476 family zinc finger protein [Halapricum desulfuricans]QSG08334.1 putative archaeal Zn-finger protein [Halapricum desulfuricans]QSG12549.1 putative archaeal Zn-finger protein [Halapricum desulfuricans]